jgi:hypothetical protein
MGCKRWRRGKGVRWPVKQKRGAGGKHDEEERWSAGDAGEDGNARLGQRSIRVRAVEWRQTERRSQDEEGMKGGPTNQIEK